jgi:acyl transferase domain-containing protein
MTDPQQRLLLEAAAQLLSAAPREATGGGDAWLASAGVFIGGGATVGLHSHARASAALSALALASALPSPFPLNLPFPSPLLPSPPLPLLPHPQA